MSGLSSQRWVWRGFEVHVPSTWEMLQYSQNPETGRCAFADRYRYRFEMSWRRIEGPPDMARLVGDYESRLLERGMKKPERINRAGWQGLQGELDGQVTTRVGRHFPGSGYLLELVLLRDTGADLSAEESHLIDSFGECAPDEAGRTAWCAFGLDIRVPAGLALTACSVQPACVQMEFTDPKQRRFVRCARRGMVPEWLTTDVDEWLIQWLGHDVRPESTVAKSQLAPSHVGTVMSGRRRWSMLTGSAPARAKAWICPTDGRLYSFETAGLERDETVAGRCCHDGRVET